MNDFVAAIRERPMANGSQPLAAGHGPWISAVGHIRNPTTTTATVNNSTHTPPNPPPLPMLTTLALTSPMRLAEARDPDTCCWVFPLFSSVGGGKKFSPFPVCLPDCLELAHCQTFLPSFRRFRALYTSKSFQTTPPENVYFHLPAQN